MTTAFRAAAPSTVSTSTPNLGPLAQLAGTWVGSGFNLVALPISPPPPPDSQTNPSFFVKINATHETIAFTPISAPIPDRGFQQPDIEYLGLHYLQQVTDAVLNSALHIETGMWLNVPATTAPAQPATIVRLATVPHGDSLLMQGQANVTPFGPAPFLPVSTSPIGTFSGLGYTDHYNLPLPPGLPVGTPTGVIADPNLLLGQAVSGQNIVSTTATAAPGGILNIPFVTTNAQATQCTATFWIETVQNTDGSQFVQLQYSQTVLLNFGNIIWPHISVSTLIKQ